jgi:hypothetical protein
MALDKADLDAILSGLEQKITSTVETVAANLFEKHEADTQAAAADNAVQNRVSVVGKPDVDPEAGPKYYVHLADGSVLQTFDAGSTHMANDAGEQMAVIGRYQMGVNS